MQLLGERSNLLWLAVGAPFRASSVIAHRSFMCPPRDRFHRDFSDEGAQATDQFLNTFFDSGLDVFHAPNLPPTPAAGKTGPERLRVFKWPAHSISASPPYIDCALGDFTGGCFEPLVTNSSLAAASIRARFFLFPLTESGHMSFGARSPFGGGGSPVRRRISAILLRGLFATQWR